MEIQRDIMAKLLEWKRRDNRKPLIIRGARQIGKSWVMRKFGESHYANVAYFNFESSPDLCSEFEKTKDPKQVLKFLQLYTDAVIEPERTLIIFDEIQECNKALNTLKYFCETAPDYHIMAAGSLLGVTLAKGDSFPVGKVDFLTMYPVTFREFLREDNPKMYNYLETCDFKEPLPAIVFSAVNESYRRYQICGGMPEASLAMLENKGVERVSEILRAILTAYTLDFAKHAPGKDIPRITAIWHSVPSQLARENRKFIYKLVKDGARAREYEDALLWMQHAGMIYRVFCISKPGLPIAAYDDLSAFKIYLCDTGLLREMADMPAEALWIDNGNYVEFKGAMAENRVLQSLIAQFEVMPRYWVSSATAEVDFIQQYVINIIPIEVKAGTRLGGKSLSVYSARYTPPMAIRYSMLNLHYDGMLVNIPLALVDWTYRILAENNLLQR